MMRTERTHGLPRRTSLIIAGMTALALVFLSGCAPARYQSSYYDQAEIDDVEYLASYGVWIYMPSYGMVWSPDVVAGWQPFYYGHWMRTSDGWAWASYEPYGWLVYHYGYWGFEPEIGWFWVPSDIWYPARVEWYTFGSYAGWAPIPPPGIVWVDPWDPYDIDVWIVIDVDNFANEDVGRYRIERSIYKERIDRRSVVERAPYAREIEEATRKKMPVVEIQEQPSYMRHRTVTEPPVTGERVVKTPPASDKRTVQAPKATGERAVPEPPASGKRTETELKRMILPKVEERKVERNATRVEKEVLTRRKAEETPARKSSRETPAKRSSEEKQDTKRDASKQKKR
jgi:hypothetical protein